MNSCKKQVESQRDLYFDFVRGIAIFFVIGIHAHFGKYSAVDNFAVIIRQILGVAVPIFVALSGYFSKSYITWGGVNRKIKKLYVPVLIYSIPAFFISIIRHEYSLPVTIVMFFVGGLSIYYFITLILQFYFLSPLLRCKSLIVLIICIALSMAFIYVETYIITDMKNMPLIITQGLFPLYLMYFVLGSYAFTHRQRYSPNITIWTIAAVVTLAWSVLETFQLIEAGKPAPAGIKPSEHLFSLCICVLIFSPKIKKKFKVNQFTKLISRCGAISLSIYLTHCYVIILLSRVPIISNYWFLSWILAIILSIALYALLTRIIPHRYYYIFGLVK